MNFSVLSFHFLSDRGIIIAEAVGLQLDDKIRQSNGEATISSTNTNDTISQIFDKILKRILLSLSTASIIDLINGMFSENFPRDSNITYNHTEDIDGNLKKTVADIIITLQYEGRVRRFHMEGQINDDDTIVIRVFEYGFRDALRHQTTEGNKITLPFPTPVIIFLEHSETTPDEVSLELDFGERGKIEYPVRAIKFLNYTVEELCDNKMIILLPLYLLKLRREVENAKRRKHQKEAMLQQSAKKLKELIDNSILPAITDNEKVGNITHSDAFELIKLLSRLYDYLYGGIVEFQEEEAKLMLSDILVLEYDVELAEEKAKFGAELEAEFEAKHKEEKRNIARGLKNDGFPIEIIAKNMGFSIAEIEKL